MNKVEKIKEKYKSTIPTRTFNLLANGDTTSTKKYLEYMCSVWPSVRKSSLIVNTIKEFDTLLPYITNKDIYSFPYTAFVNLLATVEQAKIDKEEKTFNRSEHADVLIENDDYILLVPLTYRGSLKYGANTKWCTASKHTQHSFNRYTQEGYLFYLIRKKPNNNLWDKVAFYLEHSDGIFGQIEIYISSDSQVVGKAFLLSSDWLVSQFAEVYAAINTYVFKNEVLRVKKKEVQDFVKVVEKLNLTKVLESYNFIKQMGESEHVVSEVNSDFKVLVDKIKSMRNELG